MRVLSVMFSAAADGRAVVMDRDTMLSYVLHRAASIVSTDPAVTIANFITAPANGTTLDVISAGLPGTASPVQVRVDFPISAGMTLFVSSAQAGPVLLYFTDPS